MDERYTALAGGVVFVGILVVVLVVRGYREKDKGYYTGAGAGLFLLLAFASVILQQHLLFWLFMFSGAALAIVGMPTIDKLMARKTAEHLQGLDISAPLRGRDLLTQTGLLKAAHRWGVGKALFLFWMLMAAAIIGVQLILGLWYEWRSGWSGWMSVDSILGITLSLTIPITIMYYRGISKALKSIR